MPDMLSILAISLALAGSALTARVSEPIGRQAELRRSTNLQARNESGGAGDDNWTPTTPPLPWAGTPQRVTCNGTEQYRVKSMPEVNFDLPEMYSGSIPIDKANATDGELFFVYVPKVSGEPVDEVTIWLNGGPGCSSLQGFWQENGPITWRGGTHAPLPNAYTWSNVTNMLWVDQPKAIGYSTGPGSTYATTADIGRDFAKWFKNWQEEFGITKYKIYVTGESWAGVYVPYVAHEMLNLNDTGHFDVRGILLYSPQLGQDDFVSQYTKYQFLDSHRSLYGFDDALWAQLAAEDDKAGGRAFLEKYLTFPPPGPMPVVESFGSKVEALATTAVSKTNACHNPYNVRDRCPLKWNVLGDPGNGFVAPGTQVYFKRADVKAAMHAKGDWEQCRNTAYAPGGTDTDYPLAAVIEKTHRVLISNGNFDSVINTNTTLLQIQNLTWAGQQGFQSRPNQAFIAHEQQADLAGLVHPFLVEGTKGPVRTGTWHQERGLMWVESFFAGHMQPEDDPRSTYRHIEWLTGRIEAFD